MLNERDYLRTVSQLTPEDLIRTVLGAGPDEERVLRIYLGSAQFDRIRVIGHKAQSTRAAMPVLGNVVVLHGIMGGELTLFDNDGPSLIWVGAFRLFRGQFDRLAIGPDGLSVRDVRPSGIYMRYYGSQLASLSQSWKVRPFFFDWRRDIRVAADSLFTSINEWFGPEVPVNIVAHSMGGLVARSYIARHKDRWDKGGRLVMLGTPNFGSFAIPRMLTGTNDVLALVAKIDFTHNAKELLDIAKTFPGVYQMLPVEGMLPGLDALYKAATYTQTGIDPAHFSAAAAFQAEIAKVIDPARMVYVAGYNRRTLAGINDITQLASDNGYFLSRKGDGTVPHNLGLLPGVKTFYIDEEHMSLPANTRVQSAMTALLQTGDQPDEQFLFRGLAAEFANERGTGEESQGSMQTAEAARRSIKEQQAVALRNVLVSRGDQTGNTITPEESALADVILRYEALPLTIAGDSTTGSGAALVSPDAVVSTGADAGARGADSPAAQLVPPPRTSIRIRIYQGRIEEIPAQVFPDEPPIDCIAVGHYLRVRATGAERDLDRAISPFFKGREGTPPPAAASDDDLVLSQFHDRGLLRGDLGVPFHLPDPRPGYPNTLIILAGMGPTGGFGTPELSLLAREMCWSMGRIGKKHLATVLIGASVKNLSYADAVHAWLTGINRALASAASSGENSLGTVTFAISSRTDTTRVLSAVVSALQREARDMENDAAANFHVELIDMPQVTAPKTARTGAQAATRISIEFEDGLCRYSALTDGASIAERVFRINPKRIEDLNTRLLTTEDLPEKLRLGKFLLNYLFPRDLRSQLTGSAPVVLALNAEAARVYWELAAEPFDADEDVIGDQPFLGLARGLTRQLRTVVAPPPEPPPPIGRRLRVLLVADPCRERPLPGAQQEAQLLLDLFERVNAAERSRGSDSRVLCTPLIGPARATTLDTLMNINGLPAFDVLHYAGHAVYDADHPERSGLLFSDGDMLTADDLDRIDRTPKFIFANACESGVMPSRPEKGTPDLPAAFALAFFEKGVANFLCTAWSIGDQPARDFAEELYRNLLGDGVPAVQMYEAIRYARHKIFRSVRADGVPDTRTWAAYQHYGNPYFRLFRPRVTA